MALHAFLLKYQLAGSRTGRRNGIGKPCRAGARGPGSFGHTLPQPSHVGHHRPHFRTGAVDCPAVHTALKAVVDFFLERFHRAAALPEFGIGRKRCGVVIGKMDGAGGEVAVLAVHAIAGACDRSVGAEVKSGIGNQRPPVPDLFTGGRMGNGRRVWCGPMPLHCFLLPGAVAQKRCRQQQCCRMENEEPFHR